MGIVNELPAEQGQDMAGAPEGMGPDMMQDKAAPKGGAKPEYTPDEEPNVSPEEQAQYDTTMTMLLHAIYGKEAFPQILAKLGSGRDNPAHIIGHTAAMLIRSVSGGVKEQGKQIPDDILFAVGQEVVSELIEIAIGSDIIKKEEAQKVGEAAFYEGLKTYGQAMQDAGEITPEMTQQAAQDLQEHGVPPPPNQQSAAPPTSNQPPPGPPPGQPQPGLVNQAGAQ